MYSSLYIGGAMKNRLEEFRIRNGWTQQELADQVEVSRQTIISLESGRYNPSILLAFRLARLFKLRIEDLFLYSEEEEHHG
jgi:putative transcriptional regulator